MKDSVVSIVINNYNYARFLPAAINSALNQTYRHTEIVVVDDGSKDGSQEVLKGYLDRVKVIFKENGGQASALNAGYIAAKGDIIIFLDSDDELSPDIAERVAKLFFNNRKVVKVQFRLRVIDAEGNPTGGVLPPLRISMPNGDLKLELARNRSYAHPPTSGNAFLRSAMEGLMPIPEPTYRKGAAAWLVYCIGIFGEIASINEVGGLYRIHATNITSINPYLDGAALRKHINEEICVRDKQITLFAQVLDWKIPRLGSGDLTHIKSRVILRKLFPKDYPDADHLFSLCVRGCFAALRHPNMRALDRPFWMVWFLAMLVFPRKIATALVEQVSDPSRRPGYVQKIFGRRGRR